MGSKSSKVGGGNNFQGKSTKLLSSKTSKIYGKFNKATDNKASKHMLGLTPSTDTYLESNIRHYFKNAPICEGHSRKNNMIQAASNNFGESAGTIATTHMAHGDTTSEYARASPFAVPITDSDSLCLS